MSKTEIKVIRAAILAMLKARKWWYDHHDHNIVRFEIRKDGSHG